jgi:endonuclease YncB( thermonuclease family)
MVMRTAVFAFAMMLAACAISNPAAGGLEGTVETVLSGDTLVVRIDGKKVEVRLADIGAPQGSQFYAPNARTLLAAMVEGRSAIVRETGRGEGFVFAYVRVGEINVNLEMVQRGAAWVCWDYTLDTNYMPFENRVQRLGFGVWQNMTPLQTRIECRARPPGDRLTGGAPAV